MSICASLLARACFQYALFCGPEHCLSDLQSQIDNFNISHWINETSLALDDVIVVKTTHHE